MDAGFSQPIVRLQNVYAGYDRKNAIEDVTLAVHKNDFIGVIGPNGGGKTTLIKVILGIIRPYGGSITFYEDQRKIGYLSQYQNFDSSFPISVEETVLMGLMNDWKPFFYKKKQTQQKLNKTL